MDRLDTQLGGPEEVVEDNDVQEATLKFSDTGSHLLDHFEKLMI